MEVSFRRHKLEMFILKIFIFVALDQQRSKNVDAELVIHPLWEFNSNKSDPCNFNYFGEKSKNITLSGQPSVACSLEIGVTNDSATLISIPGGPRNNSDTDILYMERKDPGCSERFVLIDSLPSPCNAVVLDKRFQLHVQGNVRVLIGDIHPQQHPQPGSCVDIEDATALVGPTTAPFCSTKSYNDVYSCNFKTSVNYGPYCYFNFPIHCNVTLGLNEITTECIDTDNSETSLVIYSDAIFTLSLSNRNLIRINVNAFKDLHNLTTLWLIRDLLTTLSSGMFNGLNNLKYLSLRYNRLRNLPGDVFSELTSLDRLFLEDNYITVIATDIFRYSYRFDEIKIDNNFVTEIDAGVFQGQDLLTFIDLSQNLLASLAVDIFKGLYALQTLLLQNNHLRSLKSPILHDLQNLTTLSVAFNLIKSIDFDLFDENKVLIFLDISKNMLQKIPLINHLSNLRHFHLEGNMLKIGNKREYSGLNPLAEIIVSQPEICICFTPSDVNCSSDNPPSPFLTCDRLLSDRVLVLFMWIIGLSAIVGNAFVLWWRITHKTNHRVQSRLIINLAMSDFLMGIYMIVIASADIQFGDNFPIQAETWRTGVTCRIAGVLSITSSEASVFLVTLISIDRFISIKYPSTTYKFGRRSTFVASILIWILAGIMGTVPSVLSGRNTDFYDNSHVCIGIPFTLVTSYSTHRFQKTVAFDRVKIGRQFFKVEKDLVTTQVTGSEPGMYFSTAVFIGLNSLCYLVILTCYIELLKVVYKASRRNALSPEMKKQVSLTTKVTAIVATDFLCWCPIIVLGILVQTEVLTLPPSVFAWAVTFILPLNSAINPYLYTIVDLISSRRKHGKRDPTDGENDGTRATEHVCDLELKIVDQGHVHPETISHD